LVVVCCDDQDVVVLPSGLIIVTELGGRVKLEPMLFQLLGVFQGPGKPDIGMAWSGTVRSGYAVLIPGIV
jgi:hypothetical protein